MTIRRSSGGLNYGHGVLPSTISKRDGVAGCIPSLISPVDWMKLTPETKSRYSQRESKEKTPRNKYDQFVTSMVTVGGRNSRDN